MADTHYAWSPIHHGDGDNRKVVKAGEKVSASSLGVDEEEFKALVEGGAVRTMPYPDMPEGYTGSPLDYMREKLAEAGNAAMSMGGSYFGPNAEELLADINEDAEPAPKAEHVSKKP